MKILLSLLILIGMSVNVNAANYHIEWSHIEDSTGFILYDNFHNEVSTFEPGVREADFVYSELDGCSSFYLVAIELDEEISSKPSNLYTLCPKEIVVEAPAVITIVVK